MVGMVIINGVWSEMRCQLGWIEWLFNSVESHWKNIKSITELELLSLSEYLVGTWLIGVKRLRLKELAMIIRSSLIDEWWRNEESHKLSWMLKSPVITKRLRMLISISLRYFITEWEESEYTFMIQRSSLLMKNEARRISLWLIMSLWKEKWNEASLMLMKIATLRHSFVMSGSLAKVSQLGWLTTPTNGTPLLSVELGIDLIVV